MKNKRLKDVPILTENLSKNMIKKFWLFYIIYIDIYLYTRIMSCTKS